MTIPPIGPTHAQPEPAEPAPEFLWVRAFVHTVLACVAVVATMLAVAFFAAPGSDTRKLGQTVGRLMWFVMAVALGTSWLHQTGRRKAALALGIGVAVLVGSTVATGIMSGKRPRDISLTAAEKAPLMITDEGGERRLNHPGFGFSLLHPGPKFVVVPELELVKPKPGQKHDDTTQGYGFVDRDSRAVFLVSVTKGMGAAREQLDEHLEGVRGGFAESLPPEADLHWGEKQVTWTESQHQARLSASFTGEMHLELAAYAVLRPGQVPFIVNLMVIAPDAAHYANVTTSLRP